MKKFFIIVRNIFIGIFLVIYFSFIILISTLLLNRNDYGVTEFGDKALILVDEDISNENYKEGTLVIIERKELTELEKGQEVFVYQPDKKDKSVNIVIANIAEIFPEDDSPYITLANNGSAWGEEYVGGTAYSTFEKLGGFLKFIESKWIFFILLIIPCFFILLYEVYLLIIAIKFDDYEEDEEEVKEVLKETPVIKEEPVEVKEETNEDKLSYIEKQIMELKANSNPEISEVIEDKNEKIDDLMQQISALRKEYDEQNTFTQEIPVLNENEALINELNDFVDANETIINKADEDNKESIVEKQEVINKKVNNNNQNNNKQKNNKQNNNNNKNNNNKHNYKNNNNQRNNNRNHNKNNNNNKNRNNNKQKNNKK